jgi:hypothetical protein
MTRENFMWVFYVRLENPLMTNRAVGAHGRAPLRRTTINVVRVEFAEVKA